MGQVPVPTYEQPVLSPAFVGAPPLPPLDAQGLEASMQQQQQQVPSTPNNKAAATKAGTVRVGGLGCR